MWQGHKFLATRDWIEFHLFNHYIIYFQIPLIEHYLLLPYDMDNMQELDFPFKSKSNPHFQIVGSCDGLFYLSNCKNFSTSCLWHCSLESPDTLETVRRHGDFKLVLGISFHCKTNDYSSSDCICKLGEMHCLRLSYTLQNWGREGISMLGHHIMRFGGCHML